MKIRVTIDIDVPPTVSSAELFAHARAIEALLNKEQDTKAPAFLGEEIKKISEGWWYEAKIQESQPFIKGGK